ncbi:hypothetical protein [Streptomyces sp. NPDC006012]|uniref:hypothetical protein n=1 Tax=Streptomyces sp. NPDC006012 TaxID=3364739 RepID=UPI0036861C8F
MSSVVSEDGSVEVTVGSQGEPMGPVGGTLRRCSAASSGVLVETEEAGVGGEGTFGVDPEKIHQGQATITDLGTYTRGLLGSFRTVMADTGWTGEGGNGRTIREDFLRNRDSVTDSLQAPGEVLGRTGGAILMDLGTVRGTQGGIAGDAGRLSGEYGVSGNCDGGRRG